MSKRYDSAYRIFLRYALNNILILALPILFAVVYYLITIDVIRNDVDTITTSQLSHGMTVVDKLFDDIDTMTVQLTNDYEVNYYLSRTGPFDDIGFYNIKRIAGKLLPYTLGNELLSHSLLFMEKSGFIVWESGFSSYDGFYDILFSVDGFSADSWRERILKAPENEKFFPFQTVRMNQQVAGSHIYRRNIGYGDFFLGSLIGIIDRKYLDGLLSELPRKYGGWVFIRAGDGTIISSTNPDLAAVARMDGLAADEDAFTEDRITYRVYRMKSDKTGWEYTAVLSETKVLSGVRTIRNLALVLLGVVFLIGLTASALFAFANVRPIRKLFALILGDQARPAGRIVNIYDQVEKSILLLSDSNRRLQNEVSSASRITRIYFFQNLLQGNYGSRETFDEDRKVFNVEFRDGSYCVILCRLAPLHAAGESESFPIMRDALVSAVGRRMGPGDFLIPVSFDDVAVLKSLEDSPRFREDATAFIEAVRSEIAAGTPLELAFGIGRPATDPFLLIISYNQAVTAVSFMTADNRKSYLFYDEIPTMKNSYFYPLDVEENLMKAVRASNVDLLDSLLLMVKNENFSSRSLSSIDVRNLFIALQGTVLRLLSDLPVESDPIRQRLLVLMEEKPVPGRFVSFTDILHALAEAFDNGKKSHNSMLLEKIEAYIRENFSRADLSLTVIAERFRRSENYLSNFYKDQTGEGLSEVIHRVRFERAVRLMQETDDTIDRIAAHCGYVNTGSFRRAFKRRSGLSPTDYRLKMSRRYIAG